MDTYLVSYVINYSPKDHAYTNYIYKSDKLDAEELVVKVGNYAKKKYGTDSVGILNIIKMDT